MRVPVRRSFGNPPLRLKLIIPQWLRYLGRPGRIPRVSLCSKTSMHSSMTRIALSCRCRHSSWLTSTHLCYSLNELDGINGNDGILVIGTTNHCSYFFR